MLFNQDSFISSIPERANDSTLVGNHHHQHHHHHHTQMSSTSSKTRHASSNKSKLKHAEIQTSPGKNLNKTLLTKAMSSTTCSESDSKSSNNSLDDLKSSSQLPNSLSASDLAQNAIASQMAALSNYAAHLFSQNTASSRTSLLNSSSASTGSNGVIPVAFLPITAFLPCVQSVQKFYDDMQPHKSQLEASGQSNLSTVSTSNSAGNNSFNNTAKFELPHIELNKSSVDFGQIAEGCRDTCRMFMKLTNASVLHQQHTSTATLLIEIDEASDWTIETFQAGGQSDKQTSTQQRASKLEHLKPQLAKSLSLHLDKSLSRSSTEDKGGRERLSLDLVTNYYEFFIHLDTKELTYFKELLYQQQLMRQQNSEAPLLIRTSLSIYYQLATKKYLLNRIELKYVLGYARLKTSSALDIVNFDVLDEEETEDEAADELRRHQSNRKDVDRTLTSFNDSTGSSHKFGGRNQERLVPLSNVGNIDIDVNCYFMHEDLPLDSGLQPKLLTFKDYELRIDEPIINLEAFCKQKHFARLVLIKHTREESKQLLDIEKPFKLIVEVKPKGMSYEIPVKMRLIDSHRVKPTLLPKLIQANPNTNKSVHLLASKTVLFFGRSLTNKRAYQEASPGLFNEFTVMNSNEFAIRCQIKLITYNQTAAASLFNFCMDMLDQTSSSGQTDSMTRLTLDLRPKQTLVVKIRFEPNLVDSTASLVFNGNVRMTVDGFASQRFNISMVGFLYKPCLDLDHVLQPISIVDASDGQNRLDKQLSSRNVLKSAYSLSMVRSTVIRPDSFIFRQSFRMENKSNNCKLVVFPLCTYYKLNADYLCFLEESSGLREKQFILTQVDEVISTIRLKITLTDAQFNATQDLVWFELARNEPVQLNAELHVISFGSNKIDEIEKRIEQNFRFGLLWLPTELNVFCVQGLRSLESQKAPDVASLHTHVNIEQLFWRILSNSHMLNGHVNTLFSQTMLNCSSVSMNDLSKLNSPSLLGDHSTSLNSSSSMLSTKCRIKRDDYFKLLCQCIKLVQVSVLIRSHDTAPKYIDDSFDFGSDNVLPAVVKTVEEPWSISTDSIVINNIKSDGSNVQSLAAKFALSNNLNRKLAFSFSFRQVCLDVVPTNVALKPMERVEIRVVPRKDICSKLPWHGVISISCNKLKRDIKVSLLSKPAPPAVVSTAKGMPPVPANNRRVGSLTSSSSMSQIGMPIKRMPSLTSNNLSHLNQTANLTGNPLPHSLSASTPLVNSSISLEQGTIVSEITQHTLDSLSLTPLISASFISLASSNTSNSMQKPDESLIKILHFGNYAQILFPSVYVTHTRSYELTLTNPTSSQVTWKAYASEPPFVRPVNKHQSKDLNLVQESSAQLLKSPHSVFKLVPHSGLIRGNQKQTIRIEFSPVESYGLFTQHWSIDTFTDLEDCNCKLVLSGSSIPMDELVANEAEQNDYNLRLMSSRAFKSKTNLGASTNTAPSGNKLKVDNLKENVDTYSFNNAPSISTASILSASSASSTSSSSSNIVLIKPEQLVFPDTGIDSTSVMHLLIQNREEVTRNLSLMLLIEPFHLNPKHKSLKIDKKHYMKVPIEFKPRIKGEYTDKVIIRVDGYDAPLTCLLKAKCV